MVRILHLQQRSTKFLTGWFVCSFYIFTALTAAEEQPSLPVGYQQTCLAIGIGPHDDLALRELAKKTQASIKDVNDALANPVLPSMPSWKKLFLHSKLVHENQLEIFELQIGLLAIHKELETSPALSLAEKTDLTSELEAKNRALATAIGNRQALGKKYFELEEIKRRLPRIEKAMKERKLRPKSQSGQMIKQPVA